MRTALTFALLPLGLLAGDALADRDRHHEHDYHRHGDYAKVIATQPIFETVTISQPRRHCWDETVSHQVGHDSATPMIVGGIIGGVVGNRFGDGRGQDAMTVAGALLGASIGHDMGRRETAPAPVGRQHCRTEHAVYEEQRPAGYDVTYRYHGRVYTTRMPYDPGARMRVRVHVMPDG